MNGRHYYPNCHDPPRQAIMESLISLSPLRTHQPLDVIWVCPPTPVQRKPPSRPNVSKHVLMGKIWGELQLHEI